MLFFNELRPSPFRSIGRCERLTLREIVPDARQSKVRRLTAQDAAMTSANEDGSLRRVLRPPLHSLTSTRFFASFYVMLYHFASRPAYQAGAPAIVVRFLSNGHMGVPFFFILSDFILSYSYLGSTAVGARAEEVLGSAVFPCLSRVPVITADQLPVSRADDDRCQISRIDRDADLESSQSIFGSSVELSGVDALSRSVFLFIFPTTVTPFVQNFGAVVRSLALDYFAWWLRCCILQFPSTGLTLPTRPFCIGFRCRLTRSDARYSKR